MCGGLFNKGLILCLISSWSDESSLIFSALINRFARLYINNLAFLANRVQFLSKPRDHLRFFGQLEDSIPLTCVRGIHFRAVEIALPLLLLQKAHDSLINVLRAARIRQTEHVQNFVAIEGAL